MAKGIQVDVTGFDAEQDTVQLCFRAECDRLVQRTYWKTLTLDQLRALIERLTDLHDQVVSEQRLCLAATPDAVVEKVAGKYHAGSGV